MTDGMAKKKTGSTMEPVSPVRDIYQSQKYSIPYSPESQEKWRFFLPFAT